MGICGSAKDKKNKKNEKSTEKKVNIPESEITDNQKSGAVKLSSNFVEDDEINKNDYELLKQIAINATDEEIKEASNNQVNKHNNNNNNNNNNSSRLKATKKVYYKQVKIEKRSDGTVIRTTIENGKKIIETFKPKNNNKNNNNNNSNRKIINNNNNHNSNRNNNNNSNRNNNNNNHNASVKGNDFQNDALRAHNEFRRKHHSPNLILNNDLNKMAQNYANKLAKIYSLQHSNNEYKGEPLGENIFMCQGTKPTGKYMTQNWYDEINKYNFNSKSFISGTGHFTQIVWKKTKEVGFGIAQADDGSYFCVANYYPCGNFLGEFQENVLKP
jgi:uncharacterized protein YkwD